MDSSGLLTWQPNLPDDLGAFLLYYNTGSFTALGNSTGSGSSITSNSIEYSNRILFRVYPGQNYSDFKFYHIAKSSSSVNFVAPVSGYYTSKSIRAVSSADFVDASESWSNFTYYWSVNHGYYEKGSTISLSSRYLTPDHTGSSRATKVIAEFYTPIFTIEPYDSIVTKQTNITINNNSWSGNIYQDTTNNLTYIYPQYTTINENNETVTNISDNPIIYNSETNQYYTYDSVTNNYYYITYEQSATPSPAPSASPDPGASPTPAPGGDSGSTSGLMEMLQAIKDSIVQGFADLTANIKLSIENLNINIKNYFDKKLPDQFTPETAQSTSTPAPSVSPEPSASPRASPVPSASPDVSPSPLPDSGTPTPALDAGSSTNFWNIIIGGSSDDGSENGHKGILWALISLIIALISFFTGLFSGVAYLFPFLPDSVVITINACLFVVFLFVIIKFLLRSK